ncbi:hypothetical protein ACFLUZ_02175 [Chloroflexota bacterium]
MTIETREHLKKQYKEWTIKEMEAQIILNSLSPNIDNDMTVVITPDFITQFRKVEKERNDATAKRRQIINKLSELPK